MTGLNTWNKAFSGYHILQYNHIDLTRTAARDSSILSDDKRKKEYDFHAKRAHVQQYQ